MHNYQTISVQQINQYAINIFKQTFPNTTHIPTTEQIPNYGIKLYYNNDNLYIEYIVTLQQIDEYINNNTQIITQTLNEKYANIQKNFNYKMQEIERIKQLDINEYDANIQTLQQEYKHVFDKYKNIIENIIRKCYANFNPIIEFVVANDTNIIVQVVNDDSYKHTISWRDIFQRENNANS